MHRQASGLFIALSVCGVLSISIPAYHNELQNSQEIQEVPQHKPHIPIIKHEFHQHHDGYQFSYETGNGIHAQETGFIKNKGVKDHETLVQQGSVTYHDDHGNPITLMYIADEHGFQPQGAHLPTPPPIPAEIQKSLESHQQEGQLQQEEYAPEEQHQPQQQPEIPAEPQYEQYH